MLAEVMMQKLTRLRKLFTLASTPLLLVPTAVSVFSSTPISATAVSDKVDGWLYFQSAPHCFKDYAYISGDDVIKGTVGGGIAKNSIFTGFYLTRSTKKDMKCDTAVQNGLKLWGYSSLEKLLEDAGYTLKDNQWHAPENPDWRIYSAIKEKNKMLDDPNEYFDIEELYSLYYYSFLYACEVSNEVSSEKASTTAKEKAKSGNGYASYTTVNDKKITRDVIAEKKEDDQKNSGFVYHNHVMTSFKASDHLDYIRCKGDGINKHLEKITELAKKIGKPAESALAEEFEKALGEITPSDCLSIGSPSERKSCKLGHIKACLDEAQNGVPSTITDKKEKDDKIKELFADCYSKKTGETKEKILAALSGVSPSSVTAEPEPSGSSGEEPKDKCAIDGIGWLVCPVVTFLAQVSDTVKDNIDEYLVFNPSELTKRDDGSVYSYWATMRNYANVLFVIAFIIIIYSQISGMGLSSYGIKRMLPRLVVGALLVNVSFYLCAAMVDLSNAIGASAYNFISSGTSAGSGGTSPDSSASGGAWWVKLASGILAGTAMLFALGALLAGLVTVLMIALTTLLLLGVRQAIIIFAIIISPLAFVAWLLPNTEGLFKKWWQTFKTMLFVYPIIGIIYGASTLASNIIRNQYGGTDGSSVAMQIVAAVLMFVPLMLVPKVLNAAMSIGNIAAITGGLIKGKAGGFLGGAAKAKASRFENYRKMKRERRNAQIRAGSYDSKWTKGGRRIINPRWYRTKLNSGFNKISRGYGDMRAAEGEKEAAHQDHERMEMAEARINNMKVDGAYLNQEQLMEAATTGKVGKTELSAYEQRAAIKKAAAMGTSKDALELAESSTKQKDATVRKEIADALAQSGAGERSPYLGGAALADIQAGTFKKDNAIKQAASKGKITAESLSKADAYSAQQIAETLGAIKGSKKAEDVKAVENASAAAKAIEKTPKLQAKVSGNQDLQKAINTISGFTPDPQDPSEQGSNSGSGSGGSGSGGSGSGGSGSGN